MLYTTIYFCMSILGVYWRQINLARANAPFHRLDCVKCMLDELNWAKDSVGNSAEVQKSQIECFGVAQDKGTRCWKGLASAYVVLHPHGLQHPISGWQEYSCSAWELSTDTWLCEILDIMAELILSTTWATYSQNKQWQVTTIAQISVWKSGYKTGKKP